MNIGTLRLSKKLTTLIAGIVFCEYLRSTGQTLSDVEPIMIMVATYLGGQSLVDTAAAWNGKPPQ